MKFETVVYGKLIGIVQKNTSIYDSSTNEHKEFVLQNNIWRRIGREMGTDALALANLAESDIISTLSKVAPVITVSMYSWWHHFSHGMLYGGATMTSIMPTISSYFRTHHGNETRT